MSLAFFLFNGRSCTTTNGTTNGVMAPEEYNQYGRQFLVGVNYKL